MTSTQLTGNFPDWKSLTGTTLDGGYELKEIVEAEQGVATLRVRVLGDYTLKALARFYVAEKTAAQEQVNIWQSVHWLDRKDHLSVPVGAGRLLLNGFTLAYLVFQVPDETLADAIKARVLQPQEAMEVLRAAAQGLSELHAAGFVHGNVAPEEILAVGDSIKCSTERVRRINQALSLNQRPARYLAPESGKQNVTISSDVWCLGATLFETVTQKKYQPALFEEAESLRHPFGVLATCCLDPDPEKRCKLSELDRISRSTPPPPKPKPIAVPVQEKAQIGTQGPPQSMAAAAGAVSGASQTGTSGTPEKVIVVPQTAEGLTDANGNGVIRPRAESLASAPAIPLGTPREKASPGPAVWPAAVRPEGTPLETGKREPMRGDSLRRHDAASSAHEEAHRPTGERDPSYRQTAREWLEGGHAKEDGEKSSVRRGWIYAVAGFAAIFLLLWSFRSHPRRTTPIASTSAGSSATAPPTSGPSATANPKSSGQTAWPTKTLTPDAKTAPGAVDSRATTSTAKPVPGANAAANANNANANGPTRNVWRVILYTYNRQQDANTKAQDLGAKRPDLHPQAFAPNGNGGPFLVVAGGQMNRQEAARLRLRALHEGMPHDSYIQNYSK
ncbi:MAG TPA: protein kinase [Bryobacteraceae bacterium]|jgi:serine/threonine protein kinase|nr:protein kinase [Bryobacteraceae bacterium]